MSIQYINLFHYIFLGTHLSDRTKSPPRFVTSWFQSCRKVSINQLLYALIHVQFVIRFFQLVCVKLSFTLYNLPLRQAIFKVNDQVFWIGFISTNQSFNETSLFVYVWYLLSIIEPKYRWRSIYLLRYAKGTFTLFEFPIPIALLIDLFPSLQ